MKKIYTVLISLSLLSFFTSCEMKDELLGSKTDFSTQGELDLSLANNSRVITETRDVAVDNNMSVGVFDEDEVDVNNYILTILDANNKPVSIKNINNETVTSAKMSELGAQNGAIAVALDAGKYTMKAYNYDGSQETVSERPFFQGTTSFEIFVGKITSVPVTCSLQNVEVSIGLDKTFTDAFIDYSVTIDNGEDAIKTISYDDFTESEGQSKKYYFKVPTNSSNLKVSVKATVKSTNQPIQKTYTITKPADSEGNTNLSAGDAFIINLKEESAAVTQIKLGITVDFSFGGLNGDNTLNEIIKIPAENITTSDSGGSTDGDSTNEGDSDGGDDVVTPPATESIRFEGLPATYTNPGATGQKVVVTINADNGIQNLFVAIKSNNEEFSATLGSFGLDNTFDIANPGNLESVLTGSLADGEGIGLLQPGETVVGKTQYVFDVTSFMSLLPLYGNSENTFSIEVVDAQGNRKSGDLKVNIMK